MWWPTPVIPTLGRLMQEDFRLFNQLGLHSEFEANLGYRVRIFLRKQKCKRITLLNKKT